MDEQTTTAETVEETMEADWDAPILADDDAEAASGDDGDAPSGTETATTEEPSGTETATTQEPDYKALYEGVLDRQNAEKFRSVYNEQLSMTGNDALARMVAMSECGGKAYPLEADAPPQGGDFRDALMELQTLYPDVKEMPSEVMKAYQTGTPLKEAYASHRAKTDADTIAALRRENDALKKAASNRKAAPVRATNGQNVGKEDLYLKGFDSDKW